jgi:hypothetical protein
MSASRRRILGSAIPLYRDTSSFSDIVLTNACTSVLMEISVRITPA